MDCTFQEFNCVLDWLHRLSARTKGALEEGGPGAQPSFGMQTTQCWERLSDPVLLDDPLSGQTRWKAQQQRHWLLYRFSFSPLESPTFLSSWKSSSQYNTIPSGFCLASWAIRSATGMQSSSGLPKTCLNLFSRRFFWRQPVW